MCLKSISRYQLYLPILLADTTKIGQYHQYRYLSIGTSLTFTEHNIGQSKKTSDAKYSGINCLSIFKDGSNFWMYKNSFIKQNVVSRKASVIFSTSLCEGFTTKYFTFSGHFNLLDKKEHYYFVYRKQLTMDFTLNGVV